MLSLVVVPAFYLIMDDLSWLLTRMFGRMFGKKEEEAEAPENAILAERIALLAAEQSDLRDRMTALGNDRQMVRHGMAAE